MFGWLSTSYCSRTGLLDERREDLRYLSNLPKLSPLGSITGILLQNIYDLPNGNEDTIPMPGVTIRVIGQNFSSETVTNQDGEFKLNKIAPGQYSTSTLLSASFHTKAEKTNVVARGCTSIWLRTSLNGRIRGHVSGPDNKPSPDTTVTATFLDMPSHKYLFTLKPYAQTDETGRFDIGPLPPGRYLLGVNTRFPPSEEEPYLPYFYPKGPDPLQATIIELGEGEKIENLLLKLPARLEPRKFSFKVVWPDGEIAEDFSVSVYTSDFDWFEARHFSIRPVGWLELPLFTNIKYWVAGDARDEQRNFWCSKITEISPQENPRSITLVLGPDEGTCLWERARDRTKSIYDRFHKD